MDGRGQRKFETRTHEPISGQEEGRLIDGTRTTRKRQVLIGQKFREIWRNMSQQYIYRLSESVTKEGYILKY